MGTAIPRFGLPLLAKELVEEAARRRTYIVRTVYACVLYVGCLVLYFNAISQQQPGRLVTLGQGRTMFSLLVFMQFGGIYLFMPAMTCGVLTLEKERNTLSLLFLTRLGPWTIVLEKYIARLIPMFTFLLLSVPLLVVAYANGGVSRDYLISGCWLLGVTVLQVGALSLACSSFFRTTSAAFIAVYLIGFCYVFILPFADGTGLFDVGNFLSYIILGSDVSDTVPSRYQRQAEYMFLTPWMFKHASNMSVGWVVLQSLPAIASAGVFIVLARAFVVRRAFLPPRNLLLRFFRGLDALFRALNQNRLTRGIVLMRDSSRLPLHDAIRWRETTKTSLGNYRYLVRLFIVLEFSTICVCWFVAAVSDGRMSRLDSELLGILAAFLWAVATLVITVKGTSLITTERAGRTLEVLLSTPMSSRDIILQKFSGIRRLLIVLGLPLLTTALFKAWWLPASVLKHDVGLFLLSVSLSIVVYLPMIAWLSMIVGLCFHTQTRSTFAALVMIVAWIVPLGIVAGIVFTIVEFTIPWPWNLALTTLLSPAVIIFVNEFLVDIAAGNSALYRLSGELWVVVACNFAFHGLCLFAFRRACLHFADRLLGRTRPGHRVGEVEQSSEARVRC